MTLKQTVNSYTIEPGAYLSGADLSEANLRSANLSDAHLRSANLSGANLHGAHLSGANLHGADLSGAYLSEANLRSANLRGANLSEANLHGADLSGAYLSEANLRSANLSDANLSEANLHGAEHIPPLVVDMTSICAEGDIIGYKKLDGGRICKLSIPADAKRSNATGRKCRAAYAIVLDGEGVSWYSDSFIYKVGETVRPTEPFDEDRWNECSTGIHFFLTREEAEVY